MKKLVIIGAGRLGKGFIGETFSNSHWDITFIDKDPKVIEALNSHHQYCVDVHRVDRIDHHIVSGYQAYIWEDENAKESIKECDLIMMALYPENFKEAFKQMESALKKRFENHKAHKLSIVCLTNKNHLMNRFESYVLENKSSEFINWFKENVALRDSIIRRSTDSKNNYDLSIRTTAVLSLLIQEPLYVSVEDVEWMELTDHLELLKDLKVFSVNGPHVTSAFAGYYYGYKIWNEAIEDKRVSTLMNEVSKEINDTILKVYPVTKQQLDNLSVFPVAKGEMEDTIYRIGKDPIRKLSNNDRLVGIGQIAEKNQMPFDALAKAIALGYLYDNEEDEVALQLKNIVQENGIEKAIQKVSGIQANTQLYKKVIEAYNMYK